MVSPSKLGMGWSVQRGDPAVRIVPLTRCPSQGLNLSRALFDQRTTDGVPINYPHLSRALMVLQNLGYETPHSATAGGYAREAGPIDIEPLLLMFRSVAQEIHL